MTVALISRDFITLANGLNNYIANKGHLDRKFYQAITNIRKEPAFSLTSKSDFVSYVSDNYPFLMEQLFKVNYEDQKKPLEDVYDLVLSKIDPIESIEKIKLFTKSNEKRDILKQMIGEFSAYANRLSHADLEYLSATGASDRYQYFLNTLNTYIKSQDLHEVLAWLHVVADHPSFDVNNQVILMPDGTLNVALTVKRMFHFANMISVSDDDIFHIKDSNGKYLPKVGFSGAKRGTPDLLYIEGDSIKVGFASKSRDTNIEGTSFFRHVLDGAFLNSFNNLVKYAGGTKSDISFNNRGAVRNVCKLASEKFRCSLDFVPIGKRNKEHNDVATIYANTEKMLKAMVDSNVISESQKEEILFRGKNLISLNQTSRSLFFVRLNAFIKGEIQLKDVCLPVVTVKDMDIICPEKAGLVNYVTTSPMPRVMKFMEIAHGNQCTTHNAELEMLDTIYKGDENMLFRGLARKAFVVKHGNIGGGIIVTPPAQKTLMDRFSFITDGYNISKEEELSSSMLALMFTKNEYLWDAIKDEISDVMHYTSGSLLMGAPKDASPNVKFFHMGLFGEERNNIVDGLTAFVDSCNIALKNGGEIQPVIDAFFGKHSGYVSERIDNGVLLSLAERFDTESFGFVEYGIKPSSSEDMQKMQNLSSSLEMLNIRVEKQKNELRSQNSNKYNV